MSKLYENDHGFLISHQQYINELYKEMHPPVEISSKLFSIRNQYKVQKNNNKRTVDCIKYEALQKEQDNIKSKFSIFIAGAKQVLNCYEFNNKDALETAKFVYNMTGKALVKNAHGANVGSATIKSVNGSNFLFPENSIFYSKNVSDIQTHLNNETYDLILLDPPWWNKYIRRKRKKSGDAYNMLFNNDIKNLPIEHLLKDDGMVVVWCTNSQQHMDSLLTEIFPKWGIKYIGKWYWVKITSTGKPVCSFSLPPGKQPYEQIIFGCRGNLCTIPFNSKLVVSVPSAIHSHKPPLIELIKTFLPENPACLEIFARYLLPNWTSYGNEVLRLQHESLFVKV
ncbi:methyltransferase-like protein 4 [Anoplophora glabripennis]|uniref:methyltransferase-like protein 4 n=1 Tax=Anoplophora glabripennis TaxID=217634 RepID=UPI0008745D48|nr:methyltransferase-like protein 4 [Anoplophora glabripennis]